MEIHAGASLASVQLKPLARSDNAQLARKSLPEPSSSGRPHLNSSPARDRDVGLDIFFPVKPITAENAARLDSSGGYEIGQFVYLSDRPLSPTSPNLGRRSTSPPRANSTRNFNKSSLQRYSAQKVQTIRDDLARTLKPLPAARMDGSSPFTRPPTAPVPTLKHVSSVPSLFRAFQAPAGGQASSGGGPVSPRKTSEAIKASLKDVSEFEILEAHLENPSVASPPPPEPPPEPPVRSVSPVKGGSPTKGGAVPSNTNAVDGKHDAVPNHVAVIAKQSLKEVNFLLESAKRNGNSLAAAAACHAMGSVCEKVFDYHRAIKHYQKLKEYAALGSDLTLEALACNRLTVNYFTLGGNDNLRRALSCSDEQANLAVEKELRLIALLNMGICALRMDNFDESIVHFSEALRCSVLLADVRAQTRTLEYLAQAALKLHDYAAASGHLTHCLQLLRSDVKRSTDLATLMSLEQQVGELHLLWKGNSSELAMKHFLNAAAIADTHPDQRFPLHATAYQSLGRIANHVGDYRSAVFYFKKALQIVIEQQEPQSVTNAVRCQLGIAEGNLRFRNLMSVVCSEDNVGKLSSTPDGPSEPRTSSSKA
eukprot:TRINITY_DN2920_c0_g2_i1.p1 TRINITY_DN2920_c0_g2~~TRINITY_DN2920_c0_g2_i1.p1  ORF type:complete len:595 (+),score=165.56 TRINITY_DN2920_c0_g2_i1:201-1985(+)